MSRSIQLLVAVLLLLLASSSVHALTIHYGNDRAAELRSCDASLYVGEKAEARTCYQALLDSSDTLIRADAAASLGDVRMANRLYREATSDSNDPVIKTHWGNLYLETHQTSDAIALYREALVYSADYLPAQLGLAKALKDGFEGRAREELFRISSEHPDNVQALILLAGIELELQNLTTARGLLNRALIEAEKQGLPVIEIQALHAGADLLDGKSIEPWARKALEINPSYGDVYSIPAYFYIITYRYREAVELYQLAVNTDPELASARRDLGINLLRVHNVFGARHHLQKAYDIDPYDVQTVNTLKLLDKLDTMRVTLIDVPSADGKGPPIGRVYLRLDTEDADALEPYVLDLATRAMQLFTERYDFRLKQPMIIELFHDHDDFGVRTVSTPGIGLLGVTFGYLLAMDSPKARAAGEFHWASTLWHEIAHVYTLEATNHRLPRWFSEGLSVYEEWNTGPLVDRELPLEALSAIKSDTILPVDDLDLGFVRPSYSGQVQVSYMQAGLICDFISSRWGHEALVTMLKLFADGESTSDALNAAIGMDGPAFDIEFRNFLQVTYGDLLDTLDNYKTASSQLERAIEAQDWVSVEALGRDIIRRYPQRISRGNAYEPLAAAQRELGEDEEALSTLISWHELGGHEPATLQALAKMLREAGLDEKAASVLESLNWVMPYVTEERRWLGEHYLASNKPDLALREFNALLGVQSDDPAAAYLGKAQAAMLLGDAQRARQDVLQSLENAPFFRPAQRLLLELNSGDHVD